MFLGHVEKRFCVTSEEWKQIQIHIDSKCHSIDHSQPHTEPQTEQAFPHEALEQTASCIDGFNTSFSDTCSGVAKVEPQRDSLIAEVGVYCTKCSKRSVAPISVSHLVSSFTDFYDNAYGFYTLVSSVESWVDDCCDINRRAFLNDLSVFMLYCRRLLH